MTSQYSANRAACPCDSFTIDPYLWTSAGNIRTLKKPLACCNRCGRRWVPRTTHHATGSIIFKLVPPEESVRNHWISLGYADVPEIPEQLIGNSDVAEDASVLHIGLTPMILFFDRGGTSHAVVSDDEVGPLARETARTVFHRMNWERPFRLLFKAIVLCNEVPDHWLDQIGSSLEARGGVMLFGTAAKHAKELNAKLGLMQFNYLQNTPYGYVSLEPEPEPMGEGPGTELTESIKAMNMPQCQLCYELAKRMNKWGIAECRLRLDAIATEMIPRAREWWNSTDWREKTSSWWQSNRSALDSLSQAYHMAQSKKAKNAEEASAHLDAMLKISVKAQVAAAIDRYEAKTK